MGFRAASGHVFALVEAPRLKLLSCTGTRLTGQLLTQTMLSVPGPDNMSANFKIQCEMALVFWCGMSAQAWSRAIGKGCRWKTYSSKLGQALILSSLAKPCICASYGWKVWFCKFMALHCSKLGRSYTGYFGKHRGSFFSYFDVFRGRPTLSLLTCVGLPWRCG